MKVLGLGLGLGVKVLGLLRERPYRIFTLIFKKPKKRGKVTGPRRGERGGKEEDIEECSKLSLSAKEKGKAS